MLTREQSNMKVIISWKCKFTLKLLET